MSEAIRGAILEAERRRCAAMLADDGAALDALLDPRLVFSHATGVVEDKPAYLATVASGRVVYHAINWSEEGVTPLGEGTALLGGRMTLAIRVDGVEKRLDNRVLLVWALTDGEWRLVAFQSTPLKA